MLGCVAEQRGGTRRIPGRDPVAAFEYARPRGNPEAARRRLEDIRPDLAAVFQETYGAAPSPTALGNAMTTLLGMARQARQDSLALAAELAAEWEVIRFSAPDVPAWLALFASADPRDDRPEMAVNIVREFVAARAADLWYPGRRDHPPRGCIGRLYRLEGHATTTVALLPEKLREELKRRGYELDAVLPGWREAKVLHEAGSDRTPWLLSRRLGQTMVRMLIFAPGVIDIESPPR